MTHFYRFFVPTFFICLLIGCGATGTPEAGGLTGNPTVNPGNYKVEQVFLNAFPTGTVPNRILIQGDNAFIVNSLGNNVQRTNLITGQMDSNFITLPTGSNPYDLAIQGDRGFVSNFVGNSLAIVNLAQGGFPINTLNGFGDFDKPEGVAVASNGFVFVTNIALDFGTFQYGDGFVTVINSSQQVVNKIKTTQKNPQWAVAVGNTVYVVNSGATEFDFGCSCFVPLTDGGIDIFDATTAASALAPAHNIPIPINSGSPLNGFPGNLAVTPDGKTGFLGTNSGILYRVNLETRTLERGNDNPIVVSPDDTNNLMTIGIDNKGVAYVLSFNEDRIYFLSPTDNTIDSAFISVDSDPSHLEGPLSMAFHNHSEFQDVYVVMGLSEFVSVVLTN